MALLSLHNIVAIETYSSPCGRQSFVPVSLSRTGRWQCARAVGAAKGEGRTFSSDEKDENDEEKRQPFCPRSARTRWREARNGKGKKQRCQKMYQARRGGVFRVTREQGRELPSFRPMSGNAASANRHWRL